MFINMQIWSQRRLNCKELSGAQGIRKCSISFKRKNPKEFGFGYVFFNVFLFVCLSTELQH